MQGSIKRADLIQRFGLGYELGQELILCPSAVVGLGMTRDIPKPGWRHPMARSRVGNGKILLPMTDGESLTARRFQDLYEGIAGDLGGLRFPMATICLPPPRCTPAGF